MTYSDEYVARLEAQADTAAQERRSLLAVLAAVRVALGTPEGVDVTHHAARVVAEAQRVREDLAQAAAYREAMEQLARFVNAVVAAVPSDATGDAYIAHLHTVNADAAKWRAVPWDVIGSIIFDWELTNDIDDAMHELRAWYDRSKPEGVIA